MVVSPKHDDPRDNAVDGMVCVLYTHDDVNAILGLANWG